MKTPIKLYRGKKRIAFRHYNKYFRQYLKWVFTLKAGDYFASCCGCNRKVASIKFDWANCGSWDGVRKNGAGEYINGKKNKHWFIHDVCITDTTGRQHYYGGGCATPAETNEQILSFYKDVEINEHTKLTPRQEKFLAAVNNGVAVIDEHGELLPEYDGEVHND